MGKINWVKIILFIIQLILEGMNKGDAVTKAARVFGVSESAIWKHGGF